jgi:hypothetical protein
VSLFIFLATPFVALASTHTIESIPPVEWQVRESEKLPYETFVNFVMFPNTEWKRAQVVTYMKGLAEVYAQCGIKFSTVKIYTVQSPVFRPEVEKYKQDSEFAIAAMSDQTADIPRPAAYLIQELTDSGEPTGQEPFSKAWFTDFVDNVTRTHISLVDTVWMPYFVNSEEYQRPRAYNGLAHEFLHVFTQVGLHNDDPTANLMLLFIRKRRNNYILPEDCKLMINNPLVKKVETPK